jgi:hypothetical protein
MTRMTRVAWAARVARVAPGCMAGRGCRRGSPRLWRRWRLGSEGCGGTLDCKGTLPGELEGSGFKTQGGVGGVTHCPVIHTVICQKTLRDWMYKGRYSAMIGWKLAFWDELSLNLQVVGFW